MRVIITGGGTGGHVFPGIAVADEFMQRDDKNEIMFIGNENGLEARVVPKEGYPIRFVRSEGVLGRSLAKKALAITRMTGSVLSSRRIIDEVNPDIVIGSGGYVSVPAVVAAWTMSVPTLIMEQNLMPGFANRFLGKFADSVALTYFESAGYFPKGKTILTGNPIRSQIIKGKRAEALATFSLDADKFTVFVLGGSAGARKINNSMTEALEHMLDIRDSVQFLHQSGSPDYDAVRNMYRQMGFTAMVVPFLYQMAEGYAASDIIVSRAGATSLAEITALGKPSILIPYAYANAHQELNARKLLDAGACRMIRDGELDGMKMASAIKELYNAPELRAEMRRQAMTLGRPDAAQKVVDVAAAIVRARKGHV